MSCDHRTCVMNHSHTDSHQMLAEGTVSPEFHITIFNLDCKNPSSAAWLGKKLLSTGRLHLLRCGRIHFEPNWCIDARHKHITAREGLIQPNDGLILKNDAYRFRLTRKVPIPVHSRSMSMTNPHPTEKKDFAKCA